MYTFTAHSYRQDEILMLIRVANEFGFKVRTFQHVLEGYKVADEIAASGAGGSTFSDWWAYKMEAFDAIPYNAALMTERGVVVSINSDDGEEARHLNQEAAKHHQVWRGLTRGSSQDDHHQSRHPVGDRQSRGLYRSGAKTPTWQSTIMIR